MTELLPTFLLDPFIFIVLLYAALAVAIIYNDVTSFEIDILATCAAAICVCSLLLSYEINIISNICAAALMAGLAILIRKLKPSILGLGDYYLYALMGFCSGLNLLATLVTLNVLISLTTSAAYSIARNKGLLASSFPAAIPGMIAASICLWFQLSPPTNIQSYGLDTLEAALPDIIITSAAQSLIAMLAILSSTIVLTLRVLGEEPITW